MEQIVKRDIPPPVVIEDRNAPVPILNRIMPDPTGERLAAKIAAVAPAKDYENIVTIKTRVVWSREIKKQVYRGRDADGVIWEEISLGWFANFENSFEALYMGNSNPGLKAGEEIVILINREEK